MSINYLFVFHCSSIMTTNFKSAVSVSQAAAKNMIAAGKKGTIVNLSSRVCKRYLQIQCTLETYFEPNLIFSCSYFHIYQMARKAFLDCAIYSASKAALDSITRSMALELGKHGIRVNSVNLGPVWTPMWADTFQEGGEGRADVEAFMARTKARLPSGNAFIPMDDVINTLLFLASDMTTMLTGENVALDGGYCIT
jgi:NAD(P)-dependent dehydrogenase (short-subunit alcohol dehydrogenase family)